MARIEANILSSELGFSTSISLIIPQSGAKDKVLYLLHGLGDDHTAWCRYTRIETYAQQYGFCVVMPAVQRSFYSDMKYGSNYFSYIARELPMIVKQLFGISTSAKQFVGGLSMGGYGALKCALTYPKKYAACASLSGAVDIARLFKDNSDIGEFKERFAIFGKAENESIPKNVDIFSLVDGCVKKGSLVDIFLACGTDDFLYNDNLRLKNYLVDKNVKHTFTEWQGSHNWDFWEECLVKMFKFFEGVLAQ